MRVSPDSGVVIGAGPYGLAAAAHLSSAGIPIHVLGTTMEFWDRQMPAGMCLRSSWDASHISDPRRAYTVDRYQESRGVRFDRPLALANFVEYGRWFQRQVAPDVDDRRVETVEKGPSEFRVRLADGEELSAPRVIVAAGISPFAYRPAMFAEIPTNLAPHSSALRDLGEFSGLSNRRSRRGSMRSLTRRRGRSIVRTSYYARTTRRAAWSIRQS